MPTKAKTPEPRFWNSVKKSDGCWEWIGHKRNGYGRIHIGSRLVTCHRFSWEIHNGKIPKGLFVCHSCDNASCVNPSHLWLGTCTDNNRDRKAKNRNNHISGSFHPLSKLTEADVYKIIELRTSGMSYQKIADQYHVTIRTIWQIFIGKTWKQIFDKSAYYQNMQGEQNATESKTASASR